MPPVGLLDKPVTGLDETTGTTHATHTTEDGVTSYIEGRLASYVEDMWKVIGTDEYGSAVKIAPLGSVPPAPVKISGILNTPAMSLADSFYGGVLSPGFTADYLAASRMYAEPPVRRSSPAELAGRARAAADLIEERGWCQGRLRDLAGQFCAMGALQATGASNWDLEEFNGHAIRFLADRGDRRPGFLGDGPGRWNTVVGWNDAPDRTAAEVTGMLRAVASALEAQAQLSRDPMVRRMPAMAF